MQYNEPRTIVTAPDGTETIVYLEDGTVDLGRISVTTRPDSAFVRLGDSHEGRFVGTDESPKLNGFEIDFENDQH